MATTSTRLFGDYVGLFITVEL